MAKVNKKSKKSVVLSQNVPESPTESKQESVPQSNFLIENRGFFGSVWVRTAVSIILIAYLFVVLLGPLSNPVGSEFLTRPLARVVAPLHRTLFLGHGYRFFGPDPGPSHLLVYRIVDQEGNLHEFKFPDRDQIWPRLLYHRWFMLSETVYQELSLTLDQQSFEDTDREFERQIEAFKLSGKQRLANLIQKEKERVALNHANSQMRIDGLIRSIGNTLLQRHDGVEIEMFIQERSIPFPAAVLTGQKLDDPIFLSELRKIGQYRLDDKGNLLSLDDLFLYSREEQGDPDVTN